MTAVLLLYYHWLQQSLSCITTDDSSPSLVLPPITAAPLLYYHRWQQSLSCITTDDSNPSLVLPPMTAVPLLYYHRWQQSLSCITTDDSSPSLVLPSLVSQLLPPHNPPQIWSRHDFPSALPTDDKLSAPDQGHMRDVSALYNLQSHMPFKRTVDWHSYNYAPSLLS